MSISLEVTPSECWDGARRAQKIIFDTRGGQAAKNSAMLDWALRLWTRRQYIQ
jgi:hypothetical protein